MRIRELNHVAIHVADVERSREFYGGVLGLPELDRPAFDFPGAWYALGAQQLHIIGTRPDGEPVCSHNRGNHFAVAVDSGEEAQRFLESRGIPMKHNIRPDGARQIFIRDPDGFVIEFYEVQPGPEGPAI
jgi:catechol 2,3-dioxygenase-like lactoylglutathione lyase family enzyme